MAQLRTQAVRRLIEVKRQSLEELRADLHRLDLLVNHARQAVEERRDAAVAFEREVAARRAAGSVLDPRLLIGQREYAVHLKSLVADSHATHETLVVQRDEARTAVEAMHTEIRLLERLAVRKELEIANEGRRREYVVADDIELMRHERTRRLADADR